MKRSMGLLLMMVLLLQLCGCVVGNTEPAPTIPVKPEPGTLPSLPVTEPAPTQPVTSEPVPTEPKEGQLMGMAETEEEAQKIAELYGMELISYRHGLAVYYTEEDPRAVIEKGIQNGWPELEINGKMYLFE